MGLRQVYRNRQRPPPPVREAARATLVLPYQEPSRKLILLGVLLDDAGVSLEDLIRDADRHVRVADEVLHPVGAITPAREHIERSVLHGEPDLDFVRLPRHPAGGRQVTKFFIREGVQIVDQASFCFLAVLAPRYL